MTRLRASRSGGRGRNDQVVDIDALAPNGDGIATSGGRRLTVPFTIPEERVRIDIVERGRGRAVASLLEILRASPHRIAPAAVTSASMRSQA